jgi:two-component system phosphate regulon sensor histidine kinase PhoR
MKNKHLRYFIFLLTFALIGLIGLQFYWVTEALKVNQERFHHDVHEALDEVARKLEQKEILYLTNEYNKQNQFDSTAKVIDLKSNLNESVVNSGKITDKNNNWTIKNNLITNQAPTENKNKKENSIHLNTAPNGVMVWQETNSWKNAKIDSIFADYGLDVRNISQIELNKTSDLSSLTIWDSTRNYVYVNIQPDSNIINNRPTLTGGKLKIQKSLTESGFSADFNFDKIEEDVLPKKDASSLPNIKPTPKFDEKIKPNLPKNNPKREVIRIADKRDLVSYVVEKWQSRSHQIKERLNYRLIDSLLKTELHNQGINLFYEFLVETRIPQHLKDSTQKNAFRLTKNGYSPQHQLVEFLFVNDRQKQEKIMLSDFNVHLFPTELMGNQHYLHVYFPQQNAYILQNMWWMLGTSLLFVGLVLFCFAFAVSTILKQKKISEITTDFINNMTHELKTPISTVSLACEALQDPDIKQLPNQQDRYLGIIKEENDRLGRQVEKVLQIAQLDRGNFKLKIMEVNLHDIIDKALRNSAIQIENRGGIITTDLKAKLPILEADEVHLTNIICNLLDNANKYSPETPKITISTENNAEGLKISIGDNGQGMSKEHLSKVFDKFYRIPTGNVHNIKGFGLGLSYVRTMVEAHHGKISVKSEPGKGSIFTIVFPYKYVKD